VSSTVPRRTALRTAAAVVVAEASGGTLGSCTFTPDSRGDSPDPAPGLLLREDATPALLDRGRDGHRRGRPSGAG